MSDRVGKVEVVGLLVGLIAPALLLHGRLLDFDAIVRLYHSLADSL